MKTTTLLFMIILFVGCNRFIKNSILLPAYPVAPSKPVSETYFGVTIQDDYRNLEDLSDSLVLNWFKEEGMYADKVLGNISGRTRLLKKMQNYSHRKPYVVSRLNITEDDQYFFLKQGADEDVARLFYRKSFDGKEELLYDPKDFKPETGNTYVISYICPSWDGSLVVIAMTHSGMEISEIIIINMDSRTVLPQIIDHCWPSGAMGVSWLPDNSGFMYLHYPEIDHTSKLFLKDTKAVLYKIGGDPKNLNILLSRETHPELGILSEDFPFVFLTKEDKYLLGWIGGAVSYANTYYAEVKSIKDEKLKWKPLWKKEDKISGGYFEGDTFIFLSAKKSSNFQIVRISLVDPDWDNPTILVDEKKEEVIGDFRLTSEGIYYTTTRNGVEAKLYRLKEGNERQIKLPKASGRLNISTKGPGFPDLWVYTMGWLNDFIRYKYNASTNEFIEENLAPKANYPEFDDFVVKELLVPSYDGEEVPISIIHKKKIALNGKHPTLLYGYGSYGFPIRPFFSPAWLTWVEEGGVWCIAHVRGGDEKGDQWYNAGKKTTKPNTWKDMIACTEYMINEGYTSKEQTVIYSASAGGILIGRAMTERPDLFSVAIAGVGVMNTLRMEHTPNGPNSAKEFGSSKDSIECVALIEMDSYLHIQKDTKYPATLITAGMKDPRVIPWQPGKFAAKLQAENGSDKPIIFSVDFESGHGFFNTRLKNFEQMANVFSFAFWQTGHPKYSLNRNTFKKNKKY